MQQQPDAVQLYILPYVFDLEGSRGFTRVLGSTLDPASIPNKTQASDAATLFDLSLLKRPIRSATQELRHRGSCLEPI